MTLEINTDTPEIDPFEAAFKELSDLEAQGKEDGISAPRTEAKSEEPPAVQEPGPDAGSSTETATTTEEINQTTEQEKHIEEPKPDPTETLISKFSEIIDRAKPQREEPAAVQPQVEPEPEIYSKDEQDFLKSYASDWPDVIKGEALRRKQEYHQLLNYVFQEVAGQIKPMMETLQTLAERTHYTDLTTNVSDYSDIREKVIEWAGNQPTYLQSAYKHVIERGTVDEVKDLVDRYKRETGVQSTTQTQVTTPNRVTELPTATKQAAAALAPVKSKRSVVKSDGPDLSDFDGAFAAFSKDD